MANLKFLKDKKVSVCVTIFNESSESINKLLNALNNQSLKADEVIVVDASTKTQRFKKTKNQNKLKIKIINKEGASRAEGRNTAIKKARNEIIAITDAGCVPNKDWLEKITKPFKIASSQAPRNDRVFFSQVPRTDVVSGGYKMVANNNFEKAESVFLGVSRENMNKDFLPSARSMAFTKTIWKKAGGFPENLNDTAEDSLFNINLIKRGAKFKVVKDAVVFWEMPKSIYDFGFKIYRYALGDLNSGIWWHPTKKWKTHNLKILSIFARYVVGIWLLFFNYYLFLLYVLCYMLYGYKKAKWWGIILQFVSDIAIISATIRYVWDIIKKP